MDATQTADAGGKEALPIVNGVGLTMAKNFVLPDDLAALPKAFHNLVDSFFGCMATQVEAAKQRYEAAFEVYEQRVIKWDGEKQTLQNEINDLKAQLELAKTMQDDLKGKITKKEEGLQQYESYTEVLREVDMQEFSSRAQNLWERFKAFAEKYFLVNIAADLFEHSLWNRILNDLAFERDIPLPPRNSHAAKKARMAAALATIASQLGARIFTPFYKPTLNEDIEELLSRHETDCRKEAMCRALLLSPWSSHEKQEAERSLLKEVTDTVDKKLGLWIDVNIRNEFREELQALFKGAIRLWRVAQHSTNKFAAIVDEVEEQGWRVLSELNDGGPELDSQAGSVILALFPRILIVREEDDDVVFDGVGLWNWQTTIAEQEFKDDMEARPQKRTRKDRRTSNSGGSNAPTSPTKSKVPAFLAWGRSDTLDGNG